MGARVADAYPTHTEPNEASGFRYGPQSIGVDIFFDGATSLVGLPEHTNNLRLTSLTNKNEPYRFFNLDVFEYELDSGMGLYGAIPMVAPRSRAIAGCRDLGTRNPELHAAHQASSSNRNCTCTSASGCSQ